MAKNPYEIDPTDEPFDALSKEDWEDLCDYLDTALGNWFDNRGLSNWFENRGED